jgi:arylsulfatase A-like enzyme
MSIRSRNADLFIGRDATPQAAKEMIRAYLASSSWMDLNVGRVLGELDRLGLRQSTVIVFWGDHGYQLGEKGKWSKAGSVWEQGSRVPLVIVAPGAAGNGKASPRVVESIDLFPTLAELCGLPRPAGLDGRSLAPLLANPQEQWNHHAYTVWSEDGKTLTHVAVRNERFRYAMFDAGRGGEMLLDLDADPHELKNLVDDPRSAQAKADLAALAKQHAARFEQR